MRIAAFIFGLLGGLAAFGLSGFGELLVGVAGLGGATADSQNTARLIIWGPPVLALAGGAFALASPFIGAVLMGGATAAWLYFFSLTGHPFNIFNAGPVTLTGLGAFFALIATLPTPRSRGRRYEEDYRGREEFVALPTEYDQEGVAMPTRYVRQGVAEPSRPPRVLGYALSIGFVAVVAGFIALLFWHGPTTSGATVAAVPTAPTNSFGDSVPGDNAPSDGGGTTPMVLANLVIQPSTTGAALPVLDPHAYYSMLPRISQYDRFKGESWIYSLQGTSAPMKTGKLHGKDALIATVCKPHDCHDNIFAYVVAVDGSTWLGAIYMAAVDPNSISVLVGSDATQADTDRVVKMVTDFHNGG